MGRSNQTARGGMNRGSAVAALALLLACAGCLEPPVSERIEIRFVREGGAIISTDVRLRSPSDYDKNPAVQQRIRDTATQLREGRDPWSPRLAISEPQRTRFVLDEKDGEVTRAVRHAELPFASGVERFFADTGVRASYRDGPGWAELLLVPDGSGNASAQQRKEFRQKLEPWPPKVAEYLEAASDLYRYLDTRPDRARTCLGAVFRDLLDDSVRETLESPDETEAALVAAVNRTSGDVTVIFEIPPGEALSIDELSRKVHDPFPAPVSVRVPGKVLEREGYEGDLQEPLEIPARSLWNAFARLEGRWIAPDLVVAYYRHDQSGRSKGFDLDAFVARPRKAATAPAADALARAIAEGLTPPPVYRVRWSIEDASEPTESPFDRDP